MFMIWEHNCPIKQGMVFTVELPGIYIERANGVRIENNIWITRNGNKDLMKNIPITVEDIEALMKKIILFITRFECMTRNILTFYLDQPSVSLLWQSYLFYRAKKKILLYLQESVVINLPEQMTIAAFLILLPALSIFLMDL